MASTTCLVNPSASLSDKYSCSLKNSNSSPPLTLRDSKHWIYLDAKTLLYFYFVRLARAKVWLLLNSLLVLLFYIFPSSVNIFTGSNNVDDLNWHIRYNDIYCRSFGEVECVFTTELFLIFHGVDWIVTAFQKSFHYKKWIVFFY